MIQKVSQDQKTGNSHIKVCYPNIVWGIKDTCIGTIGRIDQANIPAGNTIKMHPHINDAILSYFRTGLVRHTDSEGFTADIKSDKLMLMKAGKIFYYEESVLGQIEGLQIFIRPGKKDSKPEVVFHDLQEIYSLDEWCLVASPTEKSSLQFSSQTWVSDLKANKATSFTLPELPKDNLTAILYVFQGFAEINDNYQLLKGECIVFKEEKNTDIEVENGTELVLFLTDENSDYYDAGMYSDNQI
jgi:redox-sensitive bicupin YhaK (pirin superfamily)